MPNMSAREYHEYLLKHQQQSAVQRAAPDAVDAELPLHYEIISWCKSQHPIVPYIHGATNKRSRVTEGAPDFVVIFKGQTFLVECKDKDGKPSEAQRDWIHLAELQGVTVNIVHSMREFLIAVNPNIES